MQDRYREFALDYTKRIKEYCETHNDWVRNYRNPQNENEKLSKRLYDWLQKNNFFNEDKPFTYEGLKDENGILIIDTLRELYQKYYYPLSSHGNNTTYIISIIKEIIKYCQKYQEWPHQVSNQKTIKDSSSNRIACWLSDVHYKDDKQEFKYADLKYIDGRLVKDILDELYETYHKESISIEQKLNEIIKDIKKYCEEYQEFPSLYLPPKNSREKESNRLYRWLQKRNFFSKDKPFTYYDIKNEERILFINILNELYQKYPPKDKVKELQEQHVIAITNQIIYYCLTYQEWPTHYKEPQSKKEELSNKLDYWLDKSHFNSPQNFKYAHIIYDKQLKVQDILKLYYATYGSNIRKRGTIYYTQIANQLENDQVFLLYLCIIKLFRCISTSYEEYLVTLEQIQKILTTSKINLTIDKILSYLKLPDEELSKIFYQEYQYYKLCSPEVVASSTSLAYLYQLLYVAFLGRNNIEQNTRKS